MALRNVFVDGDDILRKVARPVPEVTDRIRQLLDDMKDTMYDQDGVGIAGPQVGVMRRLFVVDIYEGDGPIELINPEILETSGSQTGNEGCLSVPGFTGIVERPNYVKMKGLNRDGEEIIVEGEGFLARALMHEYDHLDGILYKDKATELWRNE